MDISPRLLEQFLVLAEEQHFRRAAERLSMSQPPLTQAIKRLERAVGAPLIERSTRRVSLTPAGRAFALDARHLLDAQRSATERARRISSGAEGVLRLGFIGGLSYVSLPAVLARIVAELPGLQVHLQQNTSAELSEMVRVRRLDIALVRGPLLDTRDLDVVPIRTEPLVAAVPADGELAAREALDFPELRQHRFALPSRAGLPGLEELVYSYCRAAGFDPVDGGRADTFLGLVALVAGGDCVCMVPREIMHIPTPGVAYVPLGGDAPVLTTMVVVRSERNDPVVDRVLPLVSAQG